jgi:cell division protein FtsW (lipid II flippase)
MYIGLRGFLISRYSSDLFAKYAAFGITTWILLQAFINIGVNLNIIPLTGITLPFISYG